MCEANFTTPSGKSVELWARDDGLYVTAHVDGEKIGRIEFCVVETGSWPHPEVMKLCMVEVSPWLWRQGISRAMLQLAVQVADLPAVATCPYRRIIDYFSAVKIGLTATPALHTTDIFGPPIFTYGYREAVIDGFVIRNSSFTISPARDVTTIGHFGTGNLELTLSSKADVEKARHLIEISYEAN